MALDTDIRHEFLPHQAIRLHVRDWTMLLAAVAAAALPRILLAPTLGFRHDLQEYVLWGQAMNRNPWHVYSLTDANYPPLLLYFWGVWIKLYMAFSSLLHIPATLNVSTSHFIAAFGRIPFDLADLAMVALIWLVARSSLSARGAFVAAAIYGLTPALLLDGPLWGQTDGMMVLLIVAAMLYAVRGNGGLAGLLLGMAVAFKLLPIEYAPLLFVFLLARSETAVVIRFCATLTAVVVVSMAPYVFAPATSGQLHLLVVRVIASGSVASASTYNLWWLLGIAGQPAGTSYVGPFTPSNLGTILVAASLAIALALVWRDRTPTSLFLSAGLLAMAVYVFGTGQHERYLYPAIPFFFLAGLHNRHYYLYYAVASLTMLINHAMVIMTFNPYESPINVYGIRAFLLQHVAITFLIAIVNVEMLLYLALVCAKRAYAVGSVEVTSRSNTTRVMPAFQQEKRAGRRRLGQLSFLSWPNTRPLSISRVDLVVYFALGFLWLIGWCIAFYVPHMLRFVYPTATSDFPDKLIGSSLLGAVTVWLLVAVGIAYASTKLGFEQRSAVMRRMT